MANVMNRGGVVNFHERYARMPIILFNCILNLVLSLFKGVQPIVSVLLQN